MKRRTDTHGDGAQRTQPKTGGASRAPLDALTAERLARMFHALADPTRVRILAALVGTERCVGDLAAALEMSVSAVSHQLRLLRELQVVRKRRAGKHVFYALDDEHVGNLFERGLEHVKHTEENLKEERGVWYT